MKIPYICIMDKKDLEKFAPVGQKFCEGKCDRQIIKTENSVIIVCLGCNRRVMEKTLN